MPNPKSGDFSSPWKEFLAELDSKLKDPLELHCIGGFVFTFFYGLPRTTGDIDYYTAVPANLNPEEENSPLTKYGFIALVWPVCLRNM